MAIATICPNCESSYRVKDNLRGKKFVCKVCQALVLVSDEPVDEGPDLRRLFDDEDDESGLGRSPDRAKAAAETSTELELCGDTQEEMLLTRTSFDEGEARRLRPKVSVLLQAAQNPWSMPAAAFFAAWLPFSFLEPKFAWVMNVIFISLCVAGAITVKILEALEIRFANPLDLLAHSILGAFAEPAAPVRRGTSGKLGTNGYYFAMQLLIMAAVLLVHTIVLSLV